MRFGKKYDQDHDPLDEYRRLLMGSWAVIRQADVMEFGTAMLSGEGGFSWNTTTIAQDGAKGGVVVVAEGRWAVEHNATFDGPCLALSGFEQPAFVPLPERWLITGTAHQNQVGMFDPQTNHAFIWHRR